MNNARQKNFAVIQAVLKVFSNKGGQNSTTFLSCSSKKIKTLKKGQVKNQIPSLVEKTKLVLQVLKQSSSQVQESQLNKAIIMRTHYFLIVADHIFILNIRLKKYCGS